MEHKFTPVFIIGSARSGTTLTARLIFTHKDCFEYRAETLMLSVCKLKYGNIFSNGIRRRVFLDDWFRSRQFKESNIDEHEFSQLICHSKGYEDLLIKFLSAMCKSSRRSYIVDSTPAHGLFVSNIAAQCASAKFINVIRDPRSVAISQNKLGWSNPPFPFKSEKSHMHYSVVQWKDLLERIENQIKEGTPICMVRYEDLINHTESAIQKIASHLSMSRKDLDTTIISTDSDSNSAFGKIETKGELSNPLNRWKTIDKATASEITYGCGELIRKHGYPLESNAFKPHLHIRYLYFKMHIKTKRLLVKLPYFGRLISSSLEILG